jgi:hypothetical protein
MGKLVMYATFPESGKMVGCKHARFIVGLNHEGLVPVICHLGALCKCIVSDQEKVIAVPSETPQSETKEKPE